MNQQEISREIQALLPEMRASRSPETVLLKHAASRGWSPAILERVGQNFNQLKTLSVMDKAAAVEDRGRTFGILDVPKLLADYTTFKPAASATVSSDWWDAGPSGLKMASEGNVAHDRAPDWLGSLVDPNKPTTDVVTKVAAAPAPAVKVASVTEVRDYVKRAMTEVRALQQLVFDANSKMHQVFTKIAGNLAGDQRKLQEATMDLRVELPDFPFRKFSNFLRDRGISVDLEAVDMRKIASDRHGVCAVAAPAVEAWSDWQAFRGLQRHIRTSTLEKVAVDVSDWDAEVAETVKTKARQDLDPAEELLDVSGMSAEDAVKLLFQKQLEQEAGYTVPDYAPPPAEARDPFATRDRSQRQTQAPLDEADDESHEVKRKKREQEIPSSTPTPKGSTPPVTPPAAPKPVLEQVSNKAQGALDTVGKGRDRFIKDLMLVHSEKLRRHKGMQTAVRGDLTARTTLARLLLNDPILSKADPRLATSLFNTIRRANPEIASDPNLLALTLREAMSQEGILLHQYKQLLEAKENAGGAGGAGKKLPSFNFNFMGI